MNVNFERLLGYLLQSITSLLSSHSFGRWNLENNFDRGKMLLRTLKSCCLANCNRAVSKFPKYSGEISCELLWNDQQLLKPIAFSQIIHSSYKMPHKQKFLHIMSTIDNSVHKTVGRFTSVWRSVRSTYTIHTSAFIATKWIDHWPITNWICRTPWKTDGANCEALCGFQKTTTEYGKLNLSTSKFR